ncbi:MAG: DUF2336 domain-containing protein [Alphaproteobacteria bacterium]
MPPQSQPLQTLLALPLERSAEKRRAALAEAAQLFRDKGPATARQRQEYGEALAGILPRLEIQDRAHLAERLASLGEAPTYLIRQLAADPAPAVAAPVLAASPLLGDTELVEAAQKGGDERLKAIAQRATLSKPLQAAIIKSGSGPAISTLLQNKSFTLTPDLLNALTLRARSDDRIASRLAARADVPMAALAELFFALKTEGRIALTHSLAKSTERAPPAAEGQPEGEAALVKAIRSGDQAAALRAFKTYWGLSESTVERIMREPSAEALAVLCLGLGISRATYSTLILLARSESAEGQHRAAAMLSQFERFPADGARRLALEWQRAPLLAPAAPQKPADRMAQPQSAPRIEAPEPRGGIFTRKKPWGLRPPRTGNDDPT